MTYEKTDDMIVQVEALIESWLLNAVQWFNRCGWSNDATIWIEVLIATWRLVDSMVYRQTTWRFTTKGLYIGW